MTESAITIEVAVAAVLIAASAGVGYRSQKGMGAAMLGAGAFLASLLCIAGTWLGLEIGDELGGWVGLAAGILLAGFLAWKAGNKIVRGKSGRFAAGLWFGFCALCIWGVLAAGWLGLLALTLPTILIFWIGLYRISAYILPLEDKSKQRPVAFRSLLTFTMGTNYPYYVARNGEIEERVPGNAYNQFFAGPGIVRVDCDQAVYISDGIKVKGLGKPGLVFTRMFDLPPRVLDLRPHLRSFEVNALTRDGIPVRVVTFIPFRIQRHGQEPKPGGSFPFDAQAAFDVIAKEPVHGTAGQDEKERLDWRNDLIVTVATRIMQDILSKYGVDELCATDEPHRNPRLEIRQAMVDRVKEEMAGYGIEVVGGGISNLLPQTPSVMQRRLENWMTAWEQGVLMELSHGEIERVRQIEMARARAEADVILRLAQTLDEGLASGTASHTALALRFVDCLGEMATATENQWAPPPALAESLERLRGRLMSRRF